MDHKPIPVPVRFPVVSTTGKTGILPKPIVPNKLPLVPNPIPQTNKLPIVPKTNKLPIVPKTNKLPTVPIPKSPTKKISKSKSTQTLEFTPEMINDKTVFSYAKSLDRSNLKGLINFLSDYYYNDESLVSDVTFNIIENYYKEEYGDYQAEWPQVRGVKVELPYHLSSLDKITEEKEINNWENKHHGPYLLEDKIDGITLLLISEMVNGNRKLSLYTHGDGVEGEDISHVLKYITLPEIDYDIAIRGEGVYTLEIFEKFKSRFRNPRNMISGTLLAKKSFDPNIVKHLSFYAYNIRSEYNLPIEDINKLKNLGFTVPYYVIVDDINKDYLENYYLDRKKIAETEIDGTVIYDNEIIEYPTKKGQLPEQIIAFKTNVGAEMNETVVTEVVWEASKLGRLKPTVHYETSIFEKADLKQASGHNARYIFDNEIGKGAIIKVIRSCDVIPYIVEVVKSAPDGPDLPDEDIFGEYEWNDNGVELILLEDNDQVLTNKLKHFIKTLNVKQAGPKRLALIVGYGITNITDLLNSTPEELAEIPGIGINLATQILNGIREKLVDVQLAKIADASGFFPIVGETRFALIEQTYPDILAYSYDSPVKIAEMIRKIKGFDKLSDVVANNLADFANWLQLNSIQVKTVKIINGKGNKLAGKNIVVSGFREATEPELINKIKMEGGTITTAVSGKTDILILKDFTLKSMTTKYNQAVQKNKEVKKIDIITIDDFITKYL